MKVILASYFQPENHGPGRKIGITHDKPVNLDSEVNYNCDQTYQALAPDRETMIKYYVERNKIKSEAGGWDFNEAQKERMKEVGEAFQNEYRNKLEKFVNFIKDEVDRTGKSPQEIVGLQDGDTLLSLERGGNQSFRSITAEYLRELGYDVIEC